LNDKKLSEDIEQKFWSDEERYVEEIRAIELSREKLKHENESLREDVEALEGARQKLEEKTREVENLKTELEDVTQAKKEEKDMMRKLIAEGKNLLPPDRKVIVIYSICTSLLYLSTIFERSACNKINFFCSTFTWNEVVLRSNVLLRYFHFVACISLLSNFCLILSDLFLIYFNFWIGNRTSTSVWDLSFVAYL
jgi:hypothetical protein